MATTRLEVNGYFSLSKRKKYIKARYLIFKYKFEGGELEVQYILT